MMKLNSQEQNFLDELYEKQYKMLVNYARSILRDDLISEEAVQDTFYLACQKIDSIMTSKNPEGWLVLALQYTINRVQRKKKQIARHIAQMPKDFSFDNIVDDSLPDNDLDVLYPDLAAHQDWQLLKEFAVEDKPIKDIANRRGLSIDACTKRLSRVKKALGDMINKHNK